MKIRNWSKFQHFKDRRPPWIKLYRDILDDINWHQLDPLASKVLVMCWLIASEDEGRIPDVKTLAFRLRMSEKQTSECLFKLSHWLEQSDNAMISERYQDDDPETETETETEEEKEKEIEKREKVQRGTRLPADWQPSEEEIIYCKTNRPDLDWRNVAENFRDYWIAQPAGKATKIDWVATWRRWVRNEKSARKFESTRDAERRKVIEQVMGVKNDRIIDIN
jgi:hypothetical protein